MKQNMRFQNKFQAQTFSSTNICAARKKMQLQINKKINKKKKKKNWIFNSHAKIKRKINHIISLRSEGGILIYMKRKNLNLMMGKDVKYLKLKSGFRKTLSFASVSLKFAPFGIK